MITSKNRILSLVLVLTLIVSTFAAMPMTASADDYPGGVLLYESFTGIVATGSTTTATTSSQPAGTTAEIYRKRVGNDSGAGLGDYARQKDNSSTKFDATLPASYINGAETALVAAQGSNAKLTVEFDFKYEGELPAETKTLTAVLLGNSNMSGNTSGARLNSAAVAYLQSPNFITVYEKSTDEATGNPATSSVRFTLPAGITFDRWHRYSLTVNLTDASSNGGETYSFSVDGKPVVENQPTIYASEISRLHIHTTTSYITGLDNVSVYKTTDTYASLSTEELMTKLHEVNAKMEDYRMAAAGTSQLEALESAAAAAGTMVTTAFGTYDATTGAVVAAAKTQTEVDTVLANLTSADTAMQEYLAGLGEVTYPGGLLFYEPFDGTPRTQPEGTTLSTSHLVGYNPTGVSEDPEQIIEAVTDLPGSTAALKNKANYLNTIVNFPASYNADGNDGTSAVDAYAIEGKNAKLVIEYDVKTTGNAENAGDGTELFVMVGAKGMASGASGRENAAAAYALNLPDSTQTASYVTAFRKRSSSDVKTGEKFDLTKWQHHKLTIDLTNSTDGLARYSLEVDGEVIVQNQQSPGHDSNSSRAYAIEELKMYTVNENINVYLANLSVYKVNQHHKDFSPAELNILLREISEVIPSYEAAVAAGKIEQSQLDTLKNAYSDGITALSDSYEMAAEDDEAAQAALNEAVEALNEAMDALSNAVFYPLQSGQQCKLTFDDNYEKWEEIFDAYFINNLSTRYGESKTESLIHRYYNDIKADFAIEGIKAGDDAVSEGANASLILEYDLKPESYELSDSSTLKISIGNSTSVSGADNPVVYDNKDIEEFIPDVKDGVWYRFRHQINVTDENGEFAPTVSTWVNGVLVDDKIAWAHPELSETVVINDVSFHTSEGGLKAADGTAEKYGLELWYDNVMAYKANAEAPVPVNDGALVAKIRELDKEYLYSEDAALKALLDTAKAAYQDGARTQTTVDDALAALNSGYEALPESKTPYRVETFAYTNASDEKVYEAMAGGKVTGLYISKTGKKNGAEGTPMVAVYRNNVLIDIETGTFTDEDMAIGDAQVVALTTPITLPADVTGITISGYLMDSMKTLRPLSQKWTEQAYDPDRQIGLYIASTSTYADSYPVSTNYPRAGAGESMKKWLDGTNVRVYNAAWSGSTTRSYRYSTSENARNWKMIMEGGNNLQNAGTPDEIGDIFPGVQPGDYVFMSFILNDEDAGENKGTDFATDYRANLLYFIRTVREKGGIPILSCPGARGTYASSASTGWSGRTSLGSYPKAIRETAEKYGVQFTNVLGNWENMIETQIAEATAGKTGSEKTAAYTAAMLDINRTLYMRIDEVTYLWWTENGTRAIGSTIETNYQNGLAAGKGGYVSDQTHKNIYGADIEAQFVLTELLKAESALSRNIDLNRYTPVHPDPERGNTGN